jgi:thiol-disulfide isomerase/thioredoxin
MLSAFARCAGLALVALAAATPALAADRPAAAILKDIDAVEMPAFDPAQREDPKAIEAFIQARNKAMDKKGKLIRELFHADPDNARLPELFSERWRSMPPIGPQGEAMLKEIDEVTAHTKSEKLKADGAFIKLLAAMYQDFQDPEKAIPAIEAFSKKFPKDERAGELLYQVASQIQDVEKRTKIEDRLLKNYPNSPYVGMIKGARRQREAIGKPFELEFTDAIKGTNVSMKGLKGKVVVLDFWATWCGPCVGEMPNMKKLYSEYKDKGVEFIGISLDSPEDEGGLKALKEFVAENEIPWPQYYQGKGWESEFSANWGINAIPALFVVDPKGNLYSVEARGKLEEMIPELLEQAKKDAASAGR